MLNDKRLYRITPTPKKELTIDDIFIEISNFRREIRDLKKEILHLRLELLEMKKEGE